MKFSRTAISASVPERRARKSVAGEERAEKKRRESGEKAADKAEERKEPGKRYRITLFGKLIVTISPEI